MNLRRLRVTIGDTSVELEPDELDAPPTESEDTDRASRDVLLLSLPPRAGDKGAGRQRFEAVADGWRFDVTVESAARAALRDRAGQAAQSSRAHTTAIVRAQIPGRVLEVFVRAGDQVEAGQRLLSLEAMKMENEVRAPRPGTIARVGVTAGERVELGDELAVIE